MTNYFSVDFGIYPSGSPYAAIYEFDNIFIWRCVTGATQYTLRVIDGDSLFTTVKILTSEEVGCDSGIASYFVPEYRVGFTTFAPQLSRSPNIIHWYNIFAEGSGNTWSGNNMFFKLVPDIPGQLSISDTIVNDNNISDVLQSTLSIEDT